MSFIKTEEFLRGITADQLEARRSVRAADEWYEAQEITGEVCVVYGKHCRVRENPLRAKRFLVDMEGSRFTVVCRDTANGVQISSLHHSMPYLEQERMKISSDTASLANEAIQRSKALEQRVELDHMTGFTAGCIWNTM